MAASVERENVLIKRRKEMKYVLTWWERPGGSPADYEAAQKRVLSVFSKWQMPESLKFHQFFSRFAYFYWGFENS